MKKNIIRLFTISLITGLIPPLLFANEEENLVNQIRINTRFFPRRSFESNTGNIKIKELDFAYTNSFKLAGKLPAKVTLFIQDIFLKDRGQDKVILPEELTGFGVGLELTTSFLDWKDTYWRIKVMPSFYTNSWRAYSSAFRMPLQSFLIFQPYKYLTWFSGVGIYIDYEREFFPILGLIYKPNNRLILRLIPSEPEVSWKINKWFDMFLNGGITNSEFEIAKDGMRRVILRYRNYYVGTGIRVTPAKNIIFSFSQGYSFGRSFKYLEENEKLKIKDGFFTEFGLTFNF